MDILQEFPIAKEGWATIAIIAGLAFIFFVFNFRVLSIVFLILTVFTVYFFRDPHRDIPAGDNLIISPADGRVIDIKSVASGDDKYNQISIFLSVFNVHVNRAPIKGDIIAKVYNPGKFLPAFAEKASLDNEQTALTIKGRKITIVVKQIAGLIARRIVCTPEVGDTVNAGQRYGIIKFGSRVDLLLPQSCLIKVKKGDKVKGGASIIGEIHE